MSFGGRVHLADHDYCPAAEAFAGSMEWDEKQLSATHILIVPLQTE